MVIRDFVVSLITHFEELCAINYNTHPHLASCSPTVDRWPDTCCLSLTPGTLAVCRLFAVRSPADHRPHPCRSPTALLLIPNRTLADHQPLLLVAQHRLSAATSVAGGRRETLVTA